MKSRALSFVALMLVACAAALPSAPAHAQRQSTADRLTALEQQLASSRSGNLDLLNQIGELRSEMQALRAQIEELQQQLEQQKQTGRTQYLDLDSRVERLESAGPALPATPAGPAASAAPAASAGSVKPGAGASTASTAAPVQPAVPARPAIEDVAPRVYGDPATLGKSGDERSAYNAAFDALKAGRYADAARLFQNFLQAHPGGTYAPNAMYWLGESYYVTQNYALAQEQFLNLLGNYPTHDKAPGALLKVGLTQYGLRQFDAAEATLNQVIQRYPGTEAARTASDRLRAIQLSRVR